jgi:hypothetical protein
MSQEPTLERALDEAIFLLPLTGYRSDSMGIEDRKQAAALLERAKPWILAAETMLVFYHPGDTAVSAGNLGKVYEEFRAATGDRG